MSQTPAPMSSAPRLPRAAKRAPGHVYYTLEENEYIATQDRPKAKRPKTQKNTELQDLGEQVKPLEWQSQKFRAKNQRGLQTIAELQSAVNAKASELEELRATILDLQDERDAAYTDLKGVTADRDNERAIQTRLSTQLRKETSSLKTVKAERDSAHDELEKARIQAQEETSFLETVEAERDSVHDELEKACTQARDMEKDRNAAYAELKQACIQLEDMKTVHEQDSAWERFRETTSFPETAEAVAALGKEDMDKLFNPQDFEHQLLATMDWPGEVEQGYQHGWVDYSTMVVQESMNHY